MYISTTFASAGLLGLVSAANYQLVQDYSGTSFFNNFNFYTGNDPTNGYVNYVDQGTAQNQGLINTNGGVAYIGVDHNNIASGRGRNSVRLESKRTYTHGLFVINLGHMPGSICGAWPAFWTLGPNWPNNGEIDIIEGVNTQNQNYMTLHSSSGCAVSGPSNGLLSPYSQDCNVAVNGNEGCSFHEPSSVSYGDGMNSNGGAIYAMEWTSSGVSIWWWNRNNPAPSDVLGSNPKPQNWGKPSANWGGGGCNWDAHFANHQLIFDMTFCGDWAGSVFSNNPSCSGRGSCQSWVQNNPGAFAPAYWSVLNLKVYQNNGQNGARVQAADLEQGSERFAAENSTQTQEEVRLCQKMGLCLPEGEAPGPQQVRPSRLRERAAASQVAPSEVPKASQTVNKESAAAEATSAVKEWLHVADAVGWAEEVEDRTI